MNQQSRNVEAAGKKPIALAVTLILLTITAMLCVMFSTQYIAEKQLQKAGTGEAIFNGLEQAKLKTEQLQELTANMLAYSEEESSLVRVTAATSLYIVQDLEREVDGLLQHGISIDKDGFSEQTLAQQYTLLQSMQDRLNVIAAGNGKLVEEDQLSLQSLDEQLEQLASITGKFNFVMKGNKNAMIRLAGGFEWIDIGKELDQYINKQAAAL